MIYRFLSTPSRDKGALKDDIDKIDVPEKVHEFIASDNFLDEVTNQRNYYTLHITYRHYEIGRASCRERV